MRLREVVGRVLFASVLLSAGSSAARQEPGRDYVRLEYLEANGDVCVDTGVRAQRDVAVEARIACTPANSTKLNYMGAVYGSSTGWIAVGDYGEGKLVSYFAVSSRAGAGVEKPYDTAFHTYYAGNGCQAIDATTNDTVAAVEMGTGADNVPINVRLFGAANDWGETPASKNRVAFFNVYRQGEKLLELVPVVRFENACLCFYDRVNDRYYEKSGADKVAGAGDFTPGPAVGAADSRVIAVGCEWYYEGTVTGAKSGLYSPGETLTFTAEPKSGYRFKEWTGDLAQATADGNRLTVTVGDATPRVVSVRARFEKVKRPHVFSMSVKASSFADGGDLVSAERRAWLVNWLKDNGFAKVYLESFRHNVYAPTELLTAARDEFRAAGFEVCGLITPTSLHLEPEETPQDGQYETCFSDPRARERLAAEVTRCAGLFDTILFDDFLYAGCPKTCPECRSADAGFRLNLVNAVCRDILDAARKANPACRCIIKYPCWYATWATKGLVPSEQTAIFGECWVGSETRDAGADPYWAYKAYGHADELCGGRCGGVWFDPLDSRPEKFVEQAYYSVLSGAPETLVHCYDYMLGVNGGTTPFGESFAGAHACGELLEERMDELRRLAGFCDAAERGEVVLGPGGVSTHRYIKDDLMYVALLNTKATPVEHEYGVAAPNEFAFPKTLMEWLGIEVIPGAAYLPGGYLRLDYVYSQVGPTVGFTADNDYFIDTGYTPANANFGFMFDFRYDGAVGSSAPRIMGTSVKANHGWAGIELGGWQDPATSWTMGEMYAFGSSEDCPSPVRPPVVTISPCLATGFRRELSMVNRVVTAADGKTYDLGKYDNLAYMNGSVWIGNCHTPDYATKVGSAPMRIYRFKIYEGEEVVHDFVPVLSPGGVAGLYDVVGDRGFREGEGFSAGPWYPADAYEDCARIAYVETDGNQHFDTGVVADTNVSIETEMAYVGAAASGENRSVGAIYGSGKGWLTVGDYGEGKLVSYCATGSRADAGVTIPYDTEFHRYRCGNGHQAIDEHVGLTQCAAEMPRTLNLRAFAVTTDYSVSPVPKPKIRMRYLKVWRGGKLIRNLVPVIAGGRVCMYDKVGRKFFFNEGTGEFKAGPRVGFVFVVR